MRTIGEKLLEVRRALGAGEAKGRRPLGVQVLDPGEREACGRERSGGCPGIAHKSFVRPSVGGDLGGLDAEPVAKAGVGGKRLHERAEERVVSIAGGRQESLVAHDRKIEASGLETHYAFERANLCQLEIDASIPALISERAARDAAIELRVRVIRDPELIADRLQGRRRGVHRTSQIPAALAETDLDARLGDAIGRVQSGIGKPDITRRANA